MLDGIRWQCMKLGGPIFPSFAQMGLENTTRSSVFHSQVFIPAPPYVVVQ